MAGYKLADGNIYDLTRVQTIFIGLCLEEEMRFKAALAGAKLPDRRKRSIPDEDRIAQREKDKLNREIAEKELRENPDKWFNKPL